MCRLLCIKSKNLFDPNQYLIDFAEACKNSKEFQGHGWGISYLVKNEWEVYKNINPIWEMSEFNFPSTNLMLVHARSAFRDKNIAIENNMPFYDEKYHFIFNGELHGVKLKVDGKIGAEKIFNFIKRMNNDDMLRAVEKSVDIIAKRSTYVRAMNFIISNKESVFLNSTFNEEPDYFTMYSSISKEKTIICSEKLKSINTWQKIPNNSTRVYK